MIKFTCPHCKKSLRVKDELAGKKANCPACKAPIQLPTESEDGAGAADDGRAAAPQGRRRGGTDHELEALAAAALGDQAAAKPEETTTVTVDFTCPHCDAELHLSADLAGKQAPCPECRRIVKVPLLAKTGPRDWRQPDKQVGPSGAMRKEEKLEGAWGNVAATRVSRDALEEAEAIPRERGKLTAAQWAMRGTMLGMLLAVGIVGIVMWKRLSTGKLENELLAQVEALAAGPETTSQPPENQAVLHLLLGEYYLDYPHKVKDGLPPVETTVGKNTVKVERDGMQQLLFARQLIERASDPWERYFLARRLLESHATPAGDPGHVAATLQLLPPGEQRFQAWRDYLRASLAQTGGSAEAVEKHAQVVQQVIQTLAPQAMGVGGPTESAEPLNLYGIFGQELVRASQQPLAQQIGESVRAGYNPKGPYPREFGALLVILGKPDLPPDKERENDTLYARDVAAGRAAGYARAQRFKEANDLIEQRLKEPTLDRAVALLVLAEVLADIKRADEADRWLTEVADIASKFPEQTGWHRVRLCELTQAAGKHDVAEKRIAMLQLTGPAQGHLRYAAILRQWEASPGSVDAAQVAQIAPECSAEGLAACYVGRQKAKLDPKAARAWAETCDPSRLRPYAMEGVLFGSLDRR